MQQLFQYYGRFQGFRGNLVGLPSWAKFILFLLALPGILLLALSIMAVVVSVLALLLITVPVYGLLRALTSRAQDKAVPDQPMAVESPGRRHVDVRIIE